MVTNLVNVLVRNFFFTGKKKFTARSIFQIEQTNSSGINIPGELGALASLAGITSANGLMANQDALLERIKGREFILRVSNKGSLKEDSYFNTYNPDYKDPFWKATIKKILGWKKTEADQNAIIENNIIKNFKENVDFMETDGGSIKILVTHTSPKKASSYANLFTDEIRLLVEEEDRSAQENRLLYLSGTLADALQDMEKAQENLKNYAFTNSALAQENFISGSLKLDEIRMEKRKVEEISNVLSILKSLIIEGDLSTSSYEAFRSSYPLIDDVDFRRILGMSETISAWTWPEVETIKAVSTTLLDRSRRLDIDIKNIEENAKIYAISAEDLAKFTRDAKIAEATYTVLIEQVKSQSLAAGFKAETFKIFERATPPITSSWPKRFMILLLGAMVGVFIGCALTLINARRRGVYYIRSALLTDSKAQLAVRTKSIRRLLLKSIPKISSFISTQRVVALDEANIKLANKKLIYVFSSGGRSSASDVARVISTKSAQSGRTIVLCDASSKSEKEIDGNSKPHDSGLPILSISDNINILHVEKETSFFTSISFDSTIKKLITHFDQVYVCGNKSDGNLGLLAFEDFSPNLVLVAGLRNTRKVDIRNIAANYPIDLLFYD